MEIADQGAHIGNCRLTISYWKLQIKNRLLEIVDQVSQIGYYRSRNYCILGIVDQVLHIGNCQSRIAYWKLSIKDCILEIINHTIASQKE